MLGHLSFGVWDLERAIAFYDAALAPLGLTRVWTKPHAVGYGPPGRGDLLALKKQVISGSASRPRLSRCVQCLITRCGRYLPF
jgi:catechol 2,3-dioxygenase-like lactoylglutathione lyase family enzyme